MQVQIRIYGIVQGVGFRPTVSRHADEFGILGTVCNKGPYVEVMADGSQEKIDAFMEAIRNRSPKRSVILKMDAVEVMHPKIYKAFDIIESEKTKGSIFVSPDIAICEDCKQEMFDPSNRRYLHPFINCTCCGPRLTILDSMPYDRERTSMHEFPMCEACHEEYTTMSDRRYDAQPVCCNECGPEVYLLRKGLRRDEAIHEARKIIKAGGILAVKGIGGFHLCCDATSEAAVELLRKRKNRPVKPFAVMMKNMETVYRNCEVEAGEEAILTGYQKPILLLKQKSDSVLCPAIAPGNPKVGVMLPYAPVQMLLFDYPDDIQMPEALVMTSGNISGAPICRTDEDVHDQLENLCDDVLSHNRKIRLRADDSVMDYYDGRPYMIRRSRGYAPLPIMLTGDNWKGQLLATGGELKNVFCIARDELFYLSPYVGDMEDARTVAAFRESVKRMEELLETEPERLACDMHPLYQTTVEAEQMHLPMDHIQHHYAHIVSCMAENDYHGPVIGVAMDGTGYGTDGTIWGGEILKADYAGFTRLASIDPFVQVGGDAASREAWRVAVALIRQFYSENDACVVIESLGICDRKQAKVQFVLAERMMNAVVSTSAGRLFDGISAILGICLCSTYEGDAAVRLQFAAQKAYGQLPKDWPSEWLAEDGEFYHLPTGQLVRAIVDARRKGEDPCVLAYAFHQSLAEMIVSACETLCEKENINTVALSGGVFQNTLLVELCHRQLKAKKINVLLHSLVPPNDGGLALGQAAASMYRKREEETCV